MVQISIIGSPCFLLGFETYAPTGFPSISDITPIPAGNIVGNVRGSITNASVLGMIAGENASDYAAMHDFEEVKQDPKINECAKFKYNHFCYGMVAVILYGYLT